MDLSIPPLLPALIFLAGPAAALESWGVPDLHERDKQEHFAGGVVLGAVGAGVAGMVAPKSTWWTRALIGVATAAVVGVAKEVADAQHPRTHDADPKDAIATVAGGTVGALAITLIWKF